MKIVVFGATNPTGGPFALVQLYEAMVNLGISTEMVFFDHVNFVETPECMYAQYADPGVTNAELLGIKPKVAARVSKSDWLIFPEVQIQTAQNLFERGYTNIVIWWLSWENAPLSLLRRFDISLLLRGSIHIFQSSYARSMARGYGYDGPIVSDYTVLPEHQVKPSIKSLDICVLAAKSKGAKQCLDILSHTHSVKLIEKMTRDEVWNVLRGARYFLDFGGHPGKDRLPREAILVDCIPVVRRVGAATHYADVPLPDFLKVDDALMSDAEGLGTLLRSLELRRAEVLESLRHARLQILKERQTFLEEVSSFLNGCLHIRCE